MEQAGRHARQQQPQVRAGVKLGLGFGVRVVNAPQGLQPVEQAGRHAGRQRAQVRARLRERLGSGVMVEVRCRVSIATREYLLGVFVPLGPVRLRAC